MRYLFLCFWLLLAGCSRETTWHAPMAMRPDTALLLPGMNAKKITFSGPVTFTTQTGTGHSSTSVATDNTKAGQKDGTAATGAGSEAASEHAGTPWWVYGLFALGGAALTLWLFRRRIGLSSLLDR